MTERETTKLTTGNNFFVYWVIIGIFIAFIGGIFFLYPALRPQIYKREPNYCGFGVAINKTSIFPSPSTSLVIIVSIEPNRLYFRYFFWCEKNGTYNFLFVFPFNVTRELLAPNNTFIDSSSSYGSAIWLQYEVNQTGPHDFSREFEIKDTFRSGSKGSYTFDLPFGFGMRQEVIGSLENELNVTFRNSIEKVYLSFTVPSPPKYRIIQTFPERESGWTSIPGMERETAGVSWEFTEEEIKQTITIYCESLDEILWNAILLFWGTVMLGIGAQIIIRTFYDCTKEKSHRNLKSSTETKPSVTDAGSSWVSENGNEIGEETLMKLYEVHYQDQQTHIDSFQRYMNIHLTVVFALLTVFIGGMLQFYREPFAFALVAIPLFILIFSEIGKKTIDRFYRRFLEGIVMVAKIENILGLDGSLATKKSIQRKPLWVDDKTFLLDRWVTDRYECSSSAEFISKARRGGIFQYAHRVFVVLEIMGLVFALASLFILLYVHCLLN